MAVSVGVEVGVEVGVGVGVSGGIMTTGSVGVLVLVEVGVGPIAVIVGSGVRVAPGVGVPLGNTVGSTVAAFGTCVKNACKSS